MTAFRYQIDLTIHIDTHYRLGQYTIVVIFTTLRYSLSFRVYSNCMCMIYVDRMVFLSERRVIYLPVHIVDNRSETLSKGDEDE